MQAGAEESFLTRLINSAGLLDPVVSLTAQLRMVTDEALASFTDAAIRRTAWRTGRFDRFLRASVCRSAWVAAGAGLADRLVSTLRVRSEALGVYTQAPVPIIMGRHLLMLGERPGRHLRPMLDRLFAMQLEGEFDGEEGGLEFARGILRELA